MDDHHPGSPRMTVSRDAKARIGQGTLGHPAGHPPQTKLLKPKLLSAPTRFPLLECSLPSLFSQEVREERTKTGIGRIWEEGVTGHILTQKPSRVLLLNFQWLPGGGHGTLS